MTLSGLPGTRDSLRVAIACPRGAKTGGPEAQHQLFRALLDFGVEAFLVSTSDSEDSVAEFQKYSPIWRGFEELSNVDYLVVPETTMALPDRWGRILSGRVVIWWLSVDNSSIPEARFFEARNFRISPKWESNRLIARLSGLMELGLKGIPDYFVRRVSLIFTPKNKESTTFRLNIGECTHIAQSIYSQRWLKQSFGQESHLVTDYIWRDEHDHDSHLESGDEHPVSFARPTVAFNPAKGGDLVKLVIRHASRSLTWVPLKGMSGEEISETLSQAALYLDLGHFPGRDRMPREAALASCPVLLARRGSARYEEDFQLDENYLLNLEEETPYSVARRVEAMVGYKSLHLINQQQFSETVRAAKERFLNEVKAWAESLEVGRNAR